MKTLKNKIMLTILIAAFFLVLSGVASAAPVTVDGIKSAGEYTGAKSLLWWNDHESIYKKNPGQMNDLYYEIGSNGSSLNIFFEVPDYARRMIWTDGVNYNGGNFDSTWGIPKEYLDAYLAGSHHNSVNMDYRTQTGSEFFQLNGTNGLIKKIYWQDEDVNLTDNFNWATSRQYLLDNKICTTQECLEYNMTASIEMEWLGFGSDAEAYSFLNSITDMQLHLSDEATGLPPVPIPGAVWLFGSGLVGLFGYRKRAKK